jgi:hypothetical protein
LGLRKVIRVMASVIREEVASALPIAGFAVIEGADLTAAVQKVSHVPCAVAHGVVEVWPLEKSRRPGRRSA